MNFEAIFGDIAYEWSLGIFATREEASAVANARLESAKKIFDGEDDDFEVSVVETSAPLRAAIWPGQAGYDEWAKARRKVRTAEDRARKAS